MASVRQVGHSIPERLIAGDKWERLQERVKVLSYIPTFKIATYGSQVGDRGRLSVRFAFVHKHFGLIFIYYAVLLNSRDIVLLLSKNVIGGHAIAIKIVTSS